MNITGVTLHFTPTAIDPDLATKLDLLHDALSGYSDEFYSVDIASDSTNEFSVLIGVTVPDGMDAASFARGLAEDAVIAGFEAAGLGILTPEAGSVVDAQVLQFA